MPRSRSCRFSRLSSFTRRLALALMLAVPIASSPAAADTEDERESFEAQLYLGLGIDTFAAPDLRRYLNPDDSNKIQERGVGGVDFAYRFWKQQSGKQVAQLWIYGQTVHGVKSTDFDARQAAGFDSTFRGFNLTGRGAQTLYILRNATSLETIVGARLELLEVGGPENRAHLYGYIQGGGLTVAGGTGDVADIYHGGGGLVMVSGGFVGSRLEIGRGWNDLFHDQPSERWMLDAELAWSQVVAGKKIHPFVELVADADGKKGPDSIQSYVGISFDPTEVFK